MFEVRVYDFCIAPESCTMNAKGRGRFRVFARVRKLAAGVGSVRRRRAAIS